MSFWLLWLVQGLPYGLELMDLRKMVAHWQEDKTRMIRTFMSDPVTETSRQVSLTLVLFLSSDLQPNCGVMKRRAGEQDGCGEHLTFSLARQPSFLMKEILSSP